MKTYINTAASIDGKISNTERIQLELSGTRDLERMDRLRAESDAIMVGLGTIQSDNPSLTVKNRELREKHGNPIRVIADSTAQIPIDSDALKGETQTIIATGNNPDPDNLKKLRDKATIIQTQTKQTDLKELLDRLSEMNIETLMVEGGGTLNHSLLREDLIDEIYIYTAPKIIGGEQAPSIVDGAGFTEDYPELELIDLEKLDNGFLHRWRVVS